MPLALPASVSQAISRSFRRPVLWARITLTMLDRVLRLYDDWTTVLPDGSGYVAAASYQTQVVKEHTLTANPPARVQMSYPGQAGDPIDLIDAIRMDGGAGGAEGQPVFMAGEEGGYAYQSVLLAHGSENGYPIQSVVVPLWLASTESTTGSVFAWVYDLADDQIPRLLAISNAVAVSSLNTSTYTETTFSFAAPPTAIRGRRIHILLRLDNHRANVRWRQSIGGLQRPQESAGYLSYSTPEALPPIVVSRPPGGGLSPLIRGLTPILGLEFDLRVRIRPYRYDGTAPPTHRERINLGRVPTLPGYLDCRYRTPGDSRIRFRLWKSATGAWAGEEVELGTTDAHTLYRDGHDGSVLHVHDGDTIAAADLVQYYQIEANFLGTAGFSAWAATTAKAVRAVVKPSTVNGFLYECTVAGNTGSSEPTWPLVPGMTVVDGTVTWRALRASFLYTAEWHAANVRFPDEIFDVCSSQQPILDALPCIGENVPSIAMRLDVSAYITEPGKLTLPLVDLGGYATQKLIRAHLKNLPIEVRLGMIQDGGESQIVTSEQLAPYFTGLIDDFTYHRDVATLNLRDATANDLDVNVPAPRVTSATPAAPLDFTDMHLIDALEQIVFSECGRPRRYKEAESWADVREALGPLWVNSRVIADPANAKGLIKEICEITGVFLVPDELGRTRLVQYPRSGSPTFALDDTNLLRDPEQGESFGSLVNACIVDHGYDGREYAGYVIDVNPDAQDAFAPGSDRHIAHKRIKSPWLGSARYNGPLLAQTAAAREVRHKAEGLRTWNAPAAFSQLAVQVGDIGTLETDVALRRYERGARRTPVTVVVISKRVSMTQDQIEFTALEVRAFKRPPQPVTPGTYFTLSATAGTAPFSVTANATGLWTDPDGGTIDEYAWDQDYDGITFQADATGANPTINYGAGTAGRKRLALRVRGTKDGISAYTIVERVVRARVAPVPQIDIVTQQAPGQPMAVTLSGAGSTSRSGQIVQRTWYLTPTGEAESLLGTGVSTTISMPYREATVRLVVTDEDGQTGQTTLLLAGNQLAPPDVTNFLIQQRGEELVLSWDPNPDQDLDGYELRGKYEPTGSMTATFTTADLLTPNGSDTLIKVTHVVLPSPRPYGTWSFFLKAKDRSGNYSANAVSILTTTTRPGDRFGLVDWSENDDSANWADSGKATDLIYESATETWFITSTGDLLGGLSSTTLGALPTATLGSLGTLEPEGIYTCEYQDLGAIMTGVRLSALPVVSYLGNPEETNVIIECRIATTGAPDWGSWFPLALADVTCRYFQIRIRLQQFDGASNVGLKDVLIVADLPTVTQSFNDLNVSGAGSGSTWTFPVAFQVTPRIGHSIQSMGTTALYLDVTAKSTTSVTVKLRRTSDGVDVGSGGTQLVDLIATGG